MIGALATTLFLGGWQVPKVTDNPLILGVLQVICFFAKAYFVVFLAMWIRGTLPRVRVDQLMSLCWKYFVPISFVTLLGAMIWFTIFPHGSVIVRVGMFLFGVAVVLYFFTRVAFHLRRARPELLLSPLS